MSTMFFYADAESIEVLCSNRSKAVLLGSDFGYGNFGDVLQHVGAVSHLQETSALDLVSIFALEAISRFVGTDALRGIYNVDALMFVATEPLRVEDLSRLGLQQVLMVNNVAVVHLYGGGFLNEMWGDFSLDIAEQLLRQVPRATYVISGQQVAASYSRRVADHIATYKPRLVGVRDRDSLRNVQEQGVAAEFSFDDAVEQLLSLSRLYQLRRGDGAFIHLNSSGYTGNDSALLEMTRHLSLVAGRVGGSALPVLFQAFQDGREQVIDSLETVKRLERAFPFAGTQTALLVEAILAPPGKWAPRVLVGEFGYSCSYHVTMWLQLNGIPCWLRGSNSYYDQKRRSLGVEGSFESFLETLPLVEHGANLEARSQWLGKLDAVVDRADRQGGSLTWEPVTPGVREFHFKGEPRLELLLGDTWQTVNQLQEEKAQLLEAHAAVAADGLVKEARCEDLESKLAQAHAALQSAEQGRDELSLQVQSANERNEVLDAELQSANAATAEAKARLERLFDTTLPASERFSSLDIVRSYVQDQQALIEGRLLACNEQLTTVGFEARRYRQQAEAEHDASVYHRARDVANTRLIQEIMASRSWRWTRPLRAVNRFAKTRRFDASGNVGLFEAVRLVGHRLPIAPSLRTRIGGWLRGLRRR